MLVLALVAFALGMWDMFIEREGDGSFMQVILPVLLIVVFIGLYARARGERLSGVRRDNPVRGTES